MKDFFQKMIAFFLALLSALGRILAEDYVAAFDNPPFDRSPLDGYTFAAGSTAGSETVSALMSSRKSSEMTSVSAATN